MKETYYAIRIGHPKRHTPYFMLNRNDYQTPALYTSKEEAKKDLPNQPDTSVVKVTLSQGR